MLKNLKKNNEGFTIIEVLIVLAIAGLILLVVFLAVPALQRNSRNTQRKSDVSALLGAFQEIVNNTNGTLPASCDGTAATCWVKTPKLSQYDSTTANVAYVKQAAVAAGGDLVVATIADRDRILIHTAAKCGAAGAYTATGASLRSVALQYIVEDTTAAVGFSLACQEL